MVLFVVTKLPNSNSTDVEDWIPTSLGFSTSFITSLIFSISYPLTYTFPFDIDIAIKSSEGLLNSFVKEFFWYIPLFPKLSLRELNTLTVKGFTA